MRIPPQIRYCGIQSTSGGGVPTPWHWMQTSHLRMQAPNMDRMTDACENITLPQTSFAGGNDPDDTARSRSNKESRRFIIALNRSRFYVNQTSFMFTG